MATTNQESRVTTKRANVCGIALAPADSRYSGLEGYAALVLGSGHPQHLVVTLLANDEGDRVEVSAADVKYKLAGELHWHGTTLNSPMRHLSLTTGGATVRESRKVTGDEYQG
jgi:hypothetical protein